MVTKSKLTFTPIEGEFPRASTILQICKKALEATGRYEAEEEHVCTRRGMKHILSIEEFEDEECSICRGKGYTVHHHDPCTECDGTGRVG